MYMIIYLFVVFFPLFFQLLVEEESVLVRSILHLKVGHEAEQVPI